MVVAPDGLLGHAQSGPSYLDALAATHHLERCFALVLALQAVVLGEPATSADVLRILARVRERHATHRVLCRKSVLLIGLCNPVIG